MAFGKSTNDLIGCNERWAVKVAKKWSLDAFTIKGVFFLLKWQKVCCEKPNDWSMVSFNATLCHPSMLRFSLFTQAIKINALISHSIRRRLNERSVIVFTYSTWYMLDRKYLSPVLPSNHVNWDFIDINPLVLIGSDWLGIGALLQLSANRLSFLIHSEEPI